MKHKNKVAGVFIQFLSMNGKRKFLKKFKKSPMRRFVEKLQGKEETKLQDLRLEVESAPEPSLIQWQNFDKSELQRQLRTVLIVCISLLLLACSLVAIVYAKDKETDFKHEFKTQDCGNLRPTLEEAWEDFLKGSEEQEGLMNCYCFEEMGNIGPRVRNIRFGADHARHCKAWFDHYTTTNLLIYLAAAAIAVVNGVIKVVLRKLSKLEKRLT